MLGDPFNELACLIRCFVKDSVKDL
jgi:hypothetical protein